MNSHQRRKIRRMQKKGELVNLIVCRLKGHKIDRRPIILHILSPEGTELYCVTCFRNLQPPWWSEVLDDLDLEIHYDLSVQTHSRGVSIVITDEVLGAAE